MPLKKLDSPNDRVRVRQEKVLAKTKEENISILQSRNFRKTFSFIRSWTFHFARYVHGMYVLTDFRWKDILFATELEENVFVVDLMDRGGVQWWGVGENTSADKFCLLIMKGGGTQYVNTF